jgi:very-short-patch-repair endonuclease
VAELFGEGVDDPVAAVAALRERLASIPSVRVENDCALGIFNFAYHAMIEDLKAAEDLMADNELVRALAGDPEAQAALRALVDDQKLIDVNELDSIPPNEELFVLPSDPWQSRAIHTVVHGSGHAVIDGPPGTGKSQTIANLIAALLGQGKSVLFVAEKRAALDVVQDRLRKVGLSELVLDLHATKLTRKRIFAQLTAAHRQIADAGPVQTSVESEVARVRKRLNDHRAFMHTPQKSGISPFGLLSARAEVSTDSFDLRFSQSELETFTAGQVADSARLLEDAAETPDLFLRNPSAPWATCEIAENGVPGAIERIREVAQDVEFVRAMLVEFQIVAETEPIFEARGRDLQALANSLTVLRASALELGPSTLEAVLRATASPLAYGFARLSRSGRAALRTLQPHLIGPFKRRKVHAALDVLRTLDGDLSRIARRLTEKDVERLSQIDVAAAFRDASRILGRPVPEGVAVAISWLRRHLGERTAAYRAVHVRGLEASLRTAGLSAFLAELANRHLAPEDWPSALKGVWLDSHLEMLRPRFAAFNGRLHDRDVDQLGALNDEHARTNVQRVLRAIARRRVEIANANREQVGLLKAELAKVRSKKTLRELVQAAPQALISLAPCVMASPLSVSQYLPRAALFDVVIFDEASQVTPAIAIAAILRGTRLVVAGDDKQLPPTSFFGRLNELEEAEGEQETVGGFESILTAVRSFAQRVRLQLHYRSLDEHLIAFSNKWIYDDELVTIPGAFGDDYGVRHDLVPPAFDDIDKDSAGSEVGRVVELAVEHAEQRPGESLGVIALGVKHAQRIQVALDQTLRDRPDLDSFFKENDDGRARFFVKNLERVQGDERDAIIITLGYGRTRGGEVSHNFGPVNQEGGERRLNVAVTRAKTRLTAVSSFAGVDLDESKLNSVGAQLLGKYLSYCASRGRDLGDRGGVPVPLNPFEEEIRQALVTRYGMQIVPQYGVGAYRIDLAVQHPEHPGRFVLAIECDGAAYHSSPTALMRDRMRQRLLEDRGWRFCRIWSTDWFNDREGELERVGAAYLAALSDDGPQTPRQTNFAAAPVLTPNRREARPRFASFSSVNDIAASNIQRLLVWIESDGKLRTDDELFEEIFRELGFRRRTERITTRLRTAVQQYSAHRSSAAT